MPAPRKRFGQHFLHDQQVIQRLVNTIAPKPGQHLVEIGPGQGALTIPVLKLIGTMDVVELDRDLIPVLSERISKVGKLNIYQADALDFDFGNLAKPGEMLRVIGNLPYNISTPLIFHLLSFAEQIEDMHFMLQKEVVDRLAAKPNDEHYGRLSVMVQYHCKVTALFDVPPDAFYPPPKVDSSIVKLVPYQTLPYYVEDYRLFETIVRQAFSHRRKTLRNCLKTLMTDDDWMRSDIDSNLRPEQLGVPEYIKLTQLLSSNKEG